MSIMDINDIINMQSDAATESTLESEIDALSKIITDTKDGSQKLDDTDEDFKLDSDDLSFTANLQYDSAESDKCELLTDDGLGIKDILDGSAEIDSFMSATSQSSQSIQDVSKETSETIDDSEKNKDSNNKTEDLTTLPETTNQNEIETTSQKDPLNANNSLSLINEVYGVEESQNSTETQSVSVPEITENIKPLSTSQDTVKSQSENSNILEDVTDNKETISISSDSTNEISKIGDSTIKNSAQETVDSGIIEEPSIQNSNEKNIETINDDINESSISEIVNLVEKEDTVKESLPLEEIEEKEKTNTNEPTAETLVEETPMEVDDLDDENNKNTESPNISKIDIVQEIIDQPNDDTETATNVDKIQAEKEKSENDIEENKIEDTKTTINEMESELVEPSVPISEIKVSLDNESSTNSFQSCLQTIDESKTSKNNENLETLGESTMIVKETLEDCNIEVKIESIATENTKSNISQVQELEKIDESEPMDVDEPINDDSEITKNTEEENITTLKVTEENINIKNIENTEVTDEEKDSKKDETSNDVKEEIDNTKEEKMEVDTITEDLESQKIDENIKTLENESINSTVESSHEKVIDKVDSIHEVETITETEQPDCTNLENINANVDTETLQETKPDCNIKLLINTESEENKIKNIETTTTVQEVISPIMESEQILENLEESDTNADNTTIIQDETKISDIKPLEDVTSLEKLNTNIIDVAASQETKTLNDTEPVEIKEHLENPNINKDDTTVSKELITTSNNESTEISEKLASSVTDTKDEMNLQEIETISNIESVQNIKDSESSSEKTKIVETVEEIKESSNLEFSENIECSKNSNVSEKTIEELEEIKTIRNIELSEIIENSETSNTNVDNDILQEIKITTNDETVDDKMVIDNEIPQDIQEHTNSESIKNSDANDLQDIKSLQDPLNIENKNTTIAEENIESEVNISDKESDLIDKEETIADNEILLCNIKNDTEKKEICEDKENKETVETTDNLVTIPEQYNDTISSEDACEVIDKNIPKSENVDDHNMEPLQTNDVKENDEKLSKDSLKNVCKELNDENLISHRVETPEDLNITLELEEPETLDKVHLIENADLKEVVDEPKSIEKMEDDVFEEKEAFMEVNLQEELIEKQETQDIHEEESEDQVEINLSIDPDGYSSPIVHNLLEDQTALKDPLADLIENENAEVPDSLVTEESDLNEILNVNQKVDEIFSSDPDSNAQGLASEILNDSENELGSDLNELLKTDENIKEVGDLDNSEILNIPSKDPPLLDEKSQDSLSILDTLQTEPMSVEEEKIESKEFESAEKEEDITLMLEESSQSPRQLQNDKFIRDLYNKCVSNNVVESKETELEDIIECNEPVSVDKENIDVDVEKQVEVNENLEDPKISLEIEGSAQLNETETLEVDTKLPVSNIENEVHLNEPTAEMSEVESAVKFLQESEERDIQNSKMIEDMTVDANSSIFVSVEDSECDNASELISDMPEMTLDPIAISEAEIISEAVKLESERKEKLELEQQLKSSVVELIDTDSMGAIETSALPTSDNLLSIIEPNEQLNILPAVSSKDIIETPLITERKLTSGTLPMASVLDDRYKEPPKIEIPEISPKLCDLPTTPKASLLIQRDAKLRQDSPDPQFGSEPKITDTPKKDISDKQQQQQQQQQQPPQYLECENVGSPRIILKIAKSAIADCSEPRSPKSPKIRSAANSPNPEDSPGQKLGKIKLKLSKGGHPSIIPSGDSHDESVGQWHTDSSTSSLSPLGVKIKLTKSSETSVTESKHEDAEESRKNEASIGMKIKLSKTGDASIVQQDNSPKEASNQKHKDTKEITQEAVALKKPDSPSIGMKIKLSKSGDASIIQQDNKAQVVEEHKETVSKAKDKTVDDVQEETRRTESPIGMKIKFSKSGDASVIANEPSEPSKEAMDIKERNEDSIKRTDSPIGVKIKLAKTKGGSASIITSETTEETKEKIDNVEGSKKGKVSKKREAPEDTSEPSKDLEQSKAKIAKLSGEGDASISDVSDESAKTGIGMKIKLSKSGDASVVHTKRDDSPSDIARKASEQPIGMKIKLSKTGDPSIIHSEVFKEAEDVAHSPKAKHSKNKDHGMSQQKAKDDSHLEMKIKLSKTGHPTIITTNELQEDSIKISNVSTVPPHKYKEHKDLLTFKESTLKALKKSHSDVTIEPIKTQSIENTMIDLHNKRKEITIAPIEAKKSKMEANLKQMLPDVTIQPIMSVKKEQQQQQQQQQKLLLESKSGSISRQQMNVINQEISITQICSLATGDTLMGERLKNALNVPNEAKGSSPLHSDCEIIEPQPELIIVNENSNSSQDVMIIDEVPPAKSTAKVPKKRGRPRRNAAAAAIPNIAVPVANFPAVELQRDPLSLDQSSVSIMQQQKMQAPPIAQQQQHQQQAAMALQQPQIAPPSAEGSERPRRTCRSQKSYAPPKRGRGRGRGKRKNESVDIPTKKPRIDQDLTAIENSTTAVIALEKLPIEPMSNLKNSPELFKALNQPTLKRAAEKLTKEIEILAVPEGAQISSESKKIDMPPQKEIQDAAQISLQQIPEGLITMSEITSKTSSKLKLTPSEPEKNPAEAVEVADVPKITVTEEEAEKAMAKVIQEEVKGTVEVVSGDQLLIPESSKDPIRIQEHQNWIAPAIRKVSSEPATRSESISTLTVIDEETRMSAESGSRSQTPARNVPVPGTSETLVNEESQGSTATTESEKVKVKNRRMEINFDPDEGPFTVDKIAEYEWPLDRKDERPAGRGETFMIQEQISQYLGVKSFKRKYPDLKRRMVDMEERNYLRENGLVSESMCDMGLTAVSSSEVLDIMCSDFPEQYEEYRKHMREKVAREHSKKQKELSAAANAERTRIDLAEMAMQSALSWNAGLNKARQDSRKCSLDLQTFTVHVPKRPLKPNQTRRDNHYPVALVPGQYTDYYREYTPAELRYYPLNTVLYGPMRPNERKFDSQSEGSQSDSDSDSSSDDSSSSSSEGTQDTEGSQSTMDEVDMELALQSDIKCKMCLNNLNKSNRPEVLIQCGTCNGNVHPSCIDLTLDMVPHIRAYAWQCTDCKTCAQCHDPADEDKMLFCDMCDRGYHIYCVGLRRVPQGRWHCQECAVCANCGSKEPGGANSDRNSVAQWQHEYKKGDKNTRVYVSTFCVPCSKLRGNQGIDN